MAGLEETTESKAQGMSGREGVEISWNKVFTGLVGVGIVAVSGFLVTTWSIPGELQEIKTKVDKLATVGDVEEAKRDAVVESKHYTDSKVSSMSEDFTELKASASSTDEKVEELREDVKEQGKEQRNFQQKLYEDISSIKIAVEKNRDDSP